MAFAGLLLLIFVSGCALVERRGGDEKARLGETGALVAEVKAFGQTLGIKPTEALSRTTADAKAPSMLWFWFQKSGTLALRGPMDIRMAVGFGAARDKIPVEQVYRVDGYSVYYRQGNEYADPRAAATPSFAAQGIVRRVTVILHEDLHGDANFALAWDIEEAVVTPLGSLAAAAYFKSRGDTANWQRAQAALDEGRQVSRDLMRIVPEAERIFAGFPLDEAKQRILDLLSGYPVYRRVFDRQVAGQHPPTVLEAKLSHDLAYFRYFDAIVAISERAPSLKALIEDLQSLPRDATLDATEKLLQELRAKYTPRSI